MWQVSFQKTNLSLPLLTSQPASTKALARLLSECVGKWLAGSLVLCSSLHCFLHRAGQGLPSEGAEQPNSLPLLFSFPEDTLSSLSWLLSLLQSRVEPRSLRLSPGLAS